MNAGFQSFAPYLKDPLVLIGFFLLLVSSAFRLLVKQGVIVPLPKAHSYRILRLILLYGFIIGLLIIILGFALKRQELINQQRTVEDIELKYNETLKHVSGLSEEQKNELVRQIVEGFRSGALSQEQVEQKLDEIKAALTRTDDSPSHNQPNASSFFEAKTNNPLPATPVEREKTSSEPQRPVDAESQRPVEPVTGVGNQSPASSNIEAARTLADVARNPVLLLTPLEHGTQCVEITSPEPGAQVRKDAWVRGTSKGLPADSYLWVLVHKKEFNGWWPQGGGAVALNEGKWEVLAIFGNPGEVGEFEVTAVVVDKQTNKDLKIWVEHTWPNGTPPINFLNPVGSCSVKIISVEKIGD